MHGHLGALRSTQLPDIEILGVYYNAPHYIKVLWRNRGGSPRPGENLLLRLSSRHGSFRGNFLDFVPIPRHNYPILSSGFSKGLVGVKGDDFAVWIKAEVNKRKLGAIRGVVESNEENNAFVTLLRSPW